MSSVVVVVVVVVVVCCLYLLSSHVSTLVHCISTFYCTHDSAGLQDEAMVTRHDDGKGQNGDGRHDGNGRQTTARVSRAMRHDGGDPRSWDGGGIVARRGQSTLSIVVTGGGSLARRQRRRWEDLATSMLKRSIGS